MSHLRNLFHPASVLSVVAVTLGLGSTAFAAGMVTGSEIKDGTVTTADIHNGSLKAKDLSTTTISQLRGATGPAGPVGAEGPSGLSGYEIVTSQQTVLANTSALVGKDCPVGKKALSADAYWGRHTDAVAVLLYSNSNGGGADALVSGLGVDDNVHLEVVCATVD